MLVGYHASHEQFSPKELLELLPLVEANGFAGAMTSDHIAPWSVRQGQSGHVWSWLGSALERSHLNFGSLAIPGGWRFHPAVLAQAIATLAQMHPGRIPWIACGSGEFMNEHVVGEGWPEKETRDARLLEGVEIMRRLFAGETVTTDGHLKTDRARLWSLPDTPPKLYAAALSPETATWAGDWADGLITVRLKPEELKEIVGNFRKNDPARPVVLQMQISWAPTLDEAKHNAWHQWRNITIEPQLYSELAMPEDFDRECKDASVEDVAAGLLACTSAKEIMEELELYRAMGFNEVYIHNAGRNQREFIEFFGRELSPHLKSF